MNRGNVELDQLAFFGRKLTAPDRSVSGAFVIDPNAGAVQQITLTGTATMTSTIHGAQGDRLTLIFLQDATGYHDLTFGNCGWSAMDDAPGTRLTLDLLMDGQNWTFTRKIFQ